MENTAPDFKKKPGKNKDLIAKKTKKKMTNKIISRGESSSINCGFFEKYGDGQ